GVATAVPARGPRASRLTRARMARRRRTDPSSPTAGPVGQSATGRGRDTGPATRPARIGFRARAPVRDRPVSLRQLGCGRLAVDDLLEGGAEGDLRDLLGLGLDALAGLRVAGRAGLALALGELQEPGPGDLLLAGLGDGEDDLLEALQHVAGGLLVDACLLGDLLDE